MYLLEEKIITSTCIMYIVYVRADGNNIGIGTGLKLCHDGDSGVSFQFLCELPEIQGEGGGGS